MRIQPIISPISYLTSVLTIDGDCFYGNCVNMKINATKVRCKKRHTYFLAFARGRRFSPANSAERHNSLAGSSRTGPPGYLYLNQAQRM
jgi:hypothetical protein